MNHAARKSSFSFCMKCENSKDTDQLPSQFSLIFIGIRLLLVSGRTNLSTWKDCTYRTRNSVNLN